MLGPLNIFKSFSRVFTEYVIGDTKKRERENILWREWWTIDYNNYISFKDLSLWGALSYSHKFLFLVSYLFSFLNRSMSLTLI